jgi:outer membrane protein OmpA-like peptidoglycan-associated protein
MRNLLTIGVLAVLVASPAFAQIGDDGRWGVGLESGLWKGIGGDHDYSNVDQFGRFYVRHGLSRSVSLDLGFKYGWLRPGVGFSGHDAGLSVDTGAGFYTRAWQPTLSAVYNLVPDGHWRPWVSGGVGLTRWDVSDLRAEDSPGLWPDGEDLRVYNEDGALVEGHGVNFTALLGIGVDYAFNDCFSAGLGVRTNVLLNQDRDNVGFSAFWGADDVDANTQLVEATLGLRYMFGGAKDVASAPVATAATTAAVGVVAPVPARVTTPAIVPAPSVPAADRDHDGILDAVDKCPDQFEDKDGFQDDDGCPDPDNDADGVLDAIDRCPNTPRSIKVDATGCPLAQEIKATLILEGVNFETNKADLDPLSTAILDGVAERLLAWPDVKIEVGGHTDSTGSAEWNRTLSQARAGTVRQYLIDNGVAANRITAKGYGPDKPIADNATEDGKAKNRRVELTRKN